ncbi:alpha/beta hydrolase [Salinibacillus xinjiangensis]|uniref:alpha/beta hydrolase n=1 Tax=Salinibacillus xinjiangensis TaxID=1229268 RepID=UPI001E4C97CC|nr:alpha/beta hydrolase [Salinibacillus xinjiangensis]
MKRKLSKSNKGTVILVHGAFEHSGRYEWLASQWQQAGFNVLYDDLPGQGKSKGLKGHIDSFDDYINTISNWIEVAKDYHSPIFLLGHSMGGLAVVRTMEELQPDVKGVILSSPGLGLESKPPKWVRFISKMIAKHYPTLRVKMNLQPYMSTRNTLFHNRDEKDPLFLNKVSIHWYHEFERAILQAFEQISNYPNVSTLIMQAGKDLLVQKQHVYRWFEALPIQNKKYYEWEHLFHEIFNEPERDEVFRYANIFIKELI